MDLQQIVSSTYEEAIKWRRNLFTLHKCTRVILEWVNDGELQSIAIEALMIMPSLLLQKCCRNSIAKEKKIIEEKIKIMEGRWLWCNFREARFIQSKLIYQNSPASIELMAKKFNNFMLSVKLNAALRLLSDTGSAGILPTTKKIIDLIK